MSNKEHESASDSKFHRGRLLDEELYEELLGSRRHLVRSYYMEQALIERKIRLRNLQALLVSTVSIFVCVSIVVFYEIGMVSDAFALSLSSIFLAIGASTLGASISFSLSRRSRRSSRTQDLELLLALDRSWELIDRLHESNEKARAQGKYTNDANEKPSPEFRVGE